MRLARFIGLELRTLGAQIGFAPVTQIARNYQNVGFPIRPESGDFFHQQIEGLASLSLGRGIFVIAKMQIGQVQQVRHGATLFYFTRGTPKNLGRMFTARYAALSAPSSK